jgi:hypothetical protein
VSWRDNVHPAADLFPLMSESELRELGEDIKRRGYLLSPITLVRVGDDFKLLDGRNRLTATELVGGVARDWKTWVESGGDLIQYTCPTMPIREHGRLDRVDGADTAADEGDIVDRTLALVHAMTNSERQRFFAEYQKRSSKTMNIMFWRPTFTAATSPANRSTNAAD